MTAGIPAIEKSVQSQVYPSNFLKINTANIDKTQ